MLIFDIETGPLPLEVLRERMPPFDPASVAVGNRGPEKAAEYIEQKRQTYEQEYVDRAALSAATGQVVAIGYLSGDSQMTVIAGQRGTEDTDERSLIASFWRQFSRITSGGRSIVGFNINGFDIPFLMRRSWILGIDIPANLKKGRWFSDYLVDLRDVWLCGQRWGDCESSLDHVARALGVGAKADAGECSGRDFHKLWFAGGKDREKAEAYLSNDLKMTYEVAKRLGVC